MRCSLCSVLRLSHCFLKRHLGSPLRKCLFQWLSNLLSPRPFMNTSEFYLGEVVEVAVTFSTLRGRVAPPTPPPCKGEYMTPPTTPPCIQGPSGTHIPHGFPYKPPPVSCRFPASFLQAFCQHGALKFFTRLRMVQLKNKTKTLPTTNLLPPNSKYKGRVGI